MPKTTLEQWRMFKAVVDAGGFNQAAETIHKSQSSIHHAVKKLEDSIGVTLFHVEGRKTRLTEEGKLLLRRSSFLLDEVSRIETVAETLSAGVETSLHIAVDEAFPQDTLYSVLENVSAEYPNLKVEVMETVLAGSNELIEQGNATIGLSPRPMNNGLNEEICRIEFVAVAHPDHALFGLNRALRYEDLKTHRQIVVRDSSLQRNASSGWLGSEQRWTVSHIRSSVDLVSRGLGYAWLPNPAIQAMLACGKMKPLPLEEGATRSGTFYLNYKDVDSLGPAARTFMAQMRLQTLDEA